jgi:hypothetical protein
MGGATFPRPPEVAATWATHQRVKGDNDLIASHVERHGNPPTVQFLG